MDRITEAAKRTSPSEGDQDLSKKILKKEHTNRV